MSTFTFRCTFVYCQVLRARILYLCREKRGNGKIKSRHIFFPKSFIFGAFYLRIFSKQKYNCQNFAVTYNNLAFLPTSFVYDVYCICIRKAKYDQYDHSFIKSWYLVCNNFRLIPPLLIDLIFTKEYLHIFTKECHLLSDK